MLQSDKGESVREAVVKSLGILVAFTDDINKFKQVCNFEYISIYLSHLMLSIDVVLGVTSHWFK